MSFPTNLLKCIAPLHVGERLLPEERFGIVHGIRRNKCKRCRATEEAARRASDPEVAQRHNAVRRRSRAAYPEQHRAERRARYRRDKSSAISGAARRRDWLGLLALADKAHRGCCDCLAVSDPIVLEHDHVGLKNDHVSLLVNRGVSLSRLLAEMEQCDVRCVTCHHIRTAVSRGFYSMRWAEDLGRLAANERGERLALWLSEFRCDGTAAERREQWVTAYLWTHPCGCGETRPAALQFHHPGHKTAEITDMVNAERPLGEIIEEIRRCTVVCANCHRKTTANSLWPRRNELAASVRMIFGIEPYEHWPA